MNILEKIGRWLSELFKPSALPEKQEKSDKKVEPPVFFRAVSVVDKPPKNEEVVERDFYFVLSANRPKWSLFKCPCGCGDVITLSLQSAHRPHWRLEKVESEHPTLHPSIWRDKGCMSHFWLKGGRVFWCHDTGTPPHQF
jgi:hypothetical protein